MAKKIATQMEVMKFYQPSANTTYYSSLAFCRDQLPLRDPTGTGCKVDAIHTLRGYENSELVALEDLSKTNIIRSVGILLKTTRTYDYGNPGGTSLQGVGVVTPPRVTVNGITFNFGVDFNPSVSATSSLPGVVRVSSSSKTVYLNNSYTSLEEALSDSALDPFRGYKTTVNYTINIPSKDPIHGSATMKFYTTFTYTLIS